MHSSRSIQGYDIFKLIVAIILLILFFLLLWRRASPPVTTASTPSSPTDSAGAAPPATLPANPAAALATSTSPSLTATPLPPPSPTQTTEPGPGDPSASPTATNTEPSTATPLPSPNATPVIEPTETPEEGTASTITACEAAVSRSRLQPGTTATILRRLNFRSSPGIQDNWLRTNIPGTQVEAIGGPDCVPHVSGAYLWWQIKLPDGEVGWSAEGSIHGTFYFMGPLQ